MESRPNAHPLNRLARAFALVVGLALLLAGSTAFASRVPPVHGLSGLEPGDPALVRPPVRNGYSGESVYFVVTDRFQNGDPANDRGGSPSADPLVHGYLPTLAGYYHGGDLAGLIQKLDYIQSLGASALWITPAFTSRWVQGNGTIGGSSAGYHGNWQTNLTQIDPHFGSNAEMQALIDDAHQRGMKVFFDIVNNHTADVIRYRGGVSQYRDKAGFPYRDAGGTVFDDRSFAGTSSFPPLDVAVSFPYTPVFVSPADATAKSPAWLNDTRLYHNRGHATLSAESARYGDPDGLDDLFTEHPDVVSGMIAAHKAMITTFGIDGFRLDGVDLVNDEFWQAFVPAIRAHAAGLGKPNFVVFGEVANAEPAVAARYATQVGVPALLDFGFQDAMRQFAAGGAPGDVLRSLYEGDDRYTHPGGNAHDLFTFVGNHDLGRLGWHIDQSQPGAPDSERQARVTLAQALMFFGRGAPVVYYGDEQGFVGDGGGADARQDMFPSQVASYNDDDLIASGSTTGDDNFDTTHPLHQVFSELSQIRLAFPALRNGAHEHRASGAAPGIYAFSRVERTQRVEFVVVANNATTSAGANVPTRSPSTTFVDVYPGSNPVLTSDADGALTVNLPALGFALYRAQSAIPASTNAPGIVMSSPSSGSQVSGQVEVRADLDRPLFAEVTFVVSVNGAPFATLGTDDNRPYRVFYDADSVPTGTTLRFKAIVDDLNGHLNAADVTVTTGTTTAVSGSVGSASIALHPAAPNPFDLQTTLSFSLPRSGHARVTVYDVQGHVIATLVDADRPAGRHSVTWNGRDQHARSVPAGLYFYRVEAGGAVGTSRVVLLGR